MTSNKIRWSLRKLVSHARLACKYRDHDMSPSRYDYTQDRVLYQAYMQCRKCGAWVIVKDKPFPNETEISGNAVAMQCPKKKEES